jgi:hypothetical protein
MAGIGEAVIELAALLDQHLGHAVADQHAAQRHVAGGDALGEGDQVRLDAEQLGREPVPSRPKPQMTSSAISKMPYLSQMRWISGQ